MALTVTETWSGQTGNLDSELVKTYARTFRVIATAGETVVDVGNATGIPTLWEQHPYDSHCWCDKVNVKRIANSRQVWEVTTTYTNKFDEDDKDDDNPLNRPWKLSWSSQSFQKVAERGIKRETIDATGATVVNAPAGNVEGPIVNSAGDGFDPPVQIEGSDWQVVAKKNIATVPTWLMDYRDAINASGITIAGISFGSQELRISGMSIGEYTVENEIGYYPFEITINQKSETWMRELLDQGTHEIRVINANGQSTESRMRIVDKAGQHVTEPVRLDGSGQKLTPDNADIDKSIFIRYQVYLKEKDFSALGLPTT
tara:strand:- start:23149 stop:24093 length:945 start_codon:yes stop_codon:yes gene_type:complete